MSDIKRKQTWEHKVTRDLYRVVGVGRMQHVDLQLVVIYQGDDLQLWVRPVGEFRERFSCVEG